jgi:L-asparaginase
VHLGTYATGSALARCGVIGVHDMTPEAAVAKLVWLLSSGATPEDTRRLMPANLVGELTARP